MCVQMPHVHARFPSFSCQEIKSSVYHSIVVKSVGSEIGILAQGLCPVLWDAHVGLNFLIRLQQQWHLIAFY